jgi:predicted Zn-dependent protease
VLVDISRRLEAAPEVHWATVSLDGAHVVDTFVDTEGTRLVHGRNALRMSLSVQSTADDGDVVDVFRSKDVHSADGLPKPDELRAWADDALARLIALRAAPRGGPYSGPVLLMGKASGVFFHEVFGHRVEGHRQKRESEGKTFLDMVGKSLLPDFVDVFDDPTIAHLEGEDLNGHYAFDDEGVPAQRAVLVDDGIFRGFLMSRSPLDGFPHSNGHGRRMAGNPPVARMGNTIVEAKKTVSESELRRLLVDEVKRQKLPYGVIVDEIEGGFTLTGRVMPNAFNVRASTTWRVYADGRPDELVRGIDLVGTPLVAFSNLVAAGAEREVFNGHCGAESGWVPVSAVAPSLLFRRLEFQLKEKGQERPPLLAKPVPSTDGSAHGGAP